MRVLTIDFIDQGDIGISRASMKVPDEVRKCVVFLAYESLEGRRLAGTAFFIGLKLSSGTGYMTCLVTARHVIEGIRNHSTDGRCYLRINTTDGNNAEIPVDLAEWVVHPEAERHIDVAVLPGVPRGSFDYRVFPLEAAVDDEVIRRAGIGVGDEVFITGLFVGHHGKMKNIPIVRVGTIAAMPEEPVRTGLGDMDAFLVEARSIGGLSGSPAFVHYGAIREDPETGKFRLLEKTQFVLLGLVHGHWAVKIPLSPPEQALDDEAVNMGIAVIVPATRIFDVLNLPSLLSVKQELEEMVQPQPDAAEPR